MRDGFKFNVLVVDDIDFNRELLKAMIERMGHCCHTAEEGKEAMKKVYEKKDFYDVIITDINMPGMSGEELALLIKGHKIHAQLVASTGDSFYKNSVFDSFLYKPFDRDSLISVFRS
jgi:CheY-like chemotaxis protein